MINPLEIATSLTPEKELENVSPYRSEIYNQEKLVKLAKILAHSFKVRKNRSVDPALKDRLEENKEVLEEIHGRFVEALNTESAALPSSVEWLLDNFYIVTEQILQTRQNFTDEFYLQLPILRSGDYKGFPRIYGLAMELIKHTDSRIDKELLVSVVDSYQSVSPLSSAEIWSLPIMLRLGLFENLRRLMEQSMVVFKQWVAAEELADKINKSKDKKSVDKLIRRLFKTEEELDPVYLIHLIQSLKETGQNTGQLIHKLEEVLAQEDINIEEFIRTQNSYQVTNRITTGNVITSLRTLSAIDWASYYEEVSLVERILRNDPMAVYQLMDKSSRDRYRHVVEDLSKGSDLSEQEIARRAVGLASRADRKGRQRHVGYYLLDEGIEELKKEVEFRPNLGQRLADAIKKAPLRFYLVTIGVLLALITAGVLAETDGGGFQEAAVLLVPLSVPAVGIANWLVTLLMTANSPVKIDLESGIPDEYKTMVAIPCFLNSKEGVQRLLRQLESRYLANQDKNLYLCLLTDLPDSKEKETEKDGELIKTALKGIRRLNKAHKGRFFLFHRKRIFNPKEGLWMGWERKRGKLIEFNKLLKGDKSTSYIVTEGNMPILKKIRYVITLDADTELPLNAAKRLVGAMIHPLNAPLLDKKLKRVSKGYGIIQPRVDVSAPTAVGTKFAQIFAEDSGLDPYSSVASDVYQDLFGRGSYIGKAIYDVDAVLTTFDDRFPENYLLSHDLIEGEFARTGLASDIQLLEHFPTGWDAFSQRQHRWIRGDWQIVDWLMPWAPNSKGELVRNTLPHVGRWKIFDNLRRSLVPPATVLLLISGWTWLRGEAVFWTATALAAYMYPLWQSLISNIFVHPKGESNEAFLASIVDEIKHTVSQAVILTILLLPSALRNIDAILKVFYRKFISKKHMLEWTTHETAEKKQAKTVRDYFYRMRYSVVWGLLLTAASQLVDFKGPILATGFGVMWAASPLAAYLISKPIKREISELSGEEKERLYEDGFRIWRFFEEFTNTEGNFLPPDNYQENPKGVVAYKTSPTNVGLYFLSVVSAVDLGYLGIRNGLNRIEKTFDTLNKLGKFNGHLYNWYDTRTLEPLNPVYVSTVDSGNLMGALVALRQSLAEFREKGQDKEQIYRAIRVVFKNLKKQIGVKNPEGVDLTKKEAIDLFFRDLKGGKKNYPETVVYWKNKLYELIDDYQYLEKGDGEELLPQIERLSKTINGMIKKMDFRFLYNKERGVFSIGYNVTENRLDDSYYDLLASEARLTSFLAIATRQVPRDHWFKLSRPMRRVKGKMMLLSWGGSMFEYLMPNLLMKEVENTIITQSNYGIVENQKRYGEEKQVPWGFSESGFYAFDFQYNYQYRLFGLPLLGLKSDLKTGLVTAPYASFMALPYMPAEVSRNLDEMRKIGARGEYGFYEAIDYTREHLPENQKVGIVQSYMAHHQGMSLLALANYLLGNILRTRFGQDPLVAACELLLQERIPKHAFSLEFPKEEKKLLRNMTIGEKLAAGPYTTAHTDWPRVNILSNGNFLTVISNAGSGYSKYKETELTGWNHDPVLDNDGLYIYIKDKETGELWSGTYQPTGKEAEMYEASFNPSKAQFLRKDNEIITRTEVVVSPDRDMEIRQMTFTNTSSQEKTLEVTSYGEVSLDDHRGRISHPAFSKLFVESEFDEEKKSLLFHRRPKKEDQQNIWLFHKLISDNNDIEVEEYETSRLEFLGRGGNVRRPRAVNEKLTNSTGVVLDPVMSLRTRIRLGAGTSVRIGFVTGVAESRQGAEEAMATVSDMKEVERVIDLGQIQSQIELQHLNISEEEARLFQRFASRIIYPDPVLRVSKELIKEVRLGQEGFFPYGISGDLPIVLVRSQNQEDTQIIRQMLLAHEYLRLKNFHFDLVILVDKASDYNNELTHSVEAIVESSLSGPWKDKAGGILIRNRDQMDKEAVVLLSAAAKIIIDCNFGNLAEHISLSMRSGRKRQYFQNEMRRKELRGYQPRKIRTIRKGGGKELRAFNGWGGFDTERDEYVIRLQGSETTPLPWVNVLSNEKFGTVVSESGLGYTYSQNSQMHKLTPWTNDWVKNHSGEIIYLSDKKTGEVWTVTSLPIREQEEYKIRHGKGYSVYEHNSHEIEQRLAVLVPLKDPVKIFRLRLFNMGEEQKEIQVSFFAELVLGQNQETVKQFTHIEYDKELKTLFAVNGYTDPTLKKSCFLSTNLKIDSAYGDRKMFLGRNGSYERPMGIINKELPGQAPKVEDSAGVIQGTIRLKPGEEKEVLFLLGEGESKEDSVKLIKHYLSFRNTAACLKEVKEFWKTTLETITVETPNENMDLLVNRWLPYQVLACRFWARAAFYQASGAFGFRDQLQDSMALIYSHPEIVREQIINSSKHQFIEGDVQHWWHPPGNVGVRTRISDDLLWLPYVTAFYLEKTGDWGILSEKTPYLSMPMLEEEEEDLYGLPTVSEVWENVYDHCIRAIERSLRFGERGLPLMGTGDWNDGLNSVGDQGKGESVWLGWFLYDILGKFTGITEKLGDKITAERYQRIREELRGNLDTKAWDGEWFARAYFDDGTALGSKTNKECSIDAIASAWSVISAGAVREKASLSMKSAEKYLVDKENRIIKLLTPAFSNMKPYPGYIQGYPKGIRENGGQYTHGVIWMVIAQALLGEGDKAVELFDILNPVNHGDNEEKIRVFKTEPYVMPADVYSNPQHLGRGGWSWYTGSAGWMYRSAVETILGLQMSDNSFQIQPCIPKSWEGFRMTVRIKGVEYMIEVVNSSGEGRGVKELYLDDKPVEKIPKLFDEKKHRVKVVI